MEHFIAIVKALSGFFHPMERDDDILMPPCTWTSDAYRVFHLLMQGAWLPGADEGLRPLALKLASVVCHFRVLTDDGRFQSLTGDIAASTLASMAGICDDCERFLMRSQVHVNHVDERWQSVLFKAVRDNDLATASLLLQFGADVNLKSMYVVRAGSYKILTPLAFATMQRRTATEDDSTLDMIRLLLHAGASQVSTTSLNSGRVHALPRACAAGDVELVRTLLEFGADLGFNRRGRNLIMIAASRDHVEVVCDLLGRWGTYGYRPDDVSVNVLTKLGTGDHGDTLRAMRTAIAARIRRRLAARVIASALRACVVVHASRRREFLANAMVLGTHPAFVGGASGFNKCVVEAIADRLEGLYRQTKPDQEVVRSLSWNSLPACTLRGLVPSAGL